MSPLIALPVLALAALVALACAVLLPVAAHVAPEMAAHIGFGMGVLPLILAAMIYFVPVLTRGRSAGAELNWLPALAFVAGMMAVLAFAWDFSALLLGLAAVLGAIAALGLTGWTLVRTQRMFGPRHRGLDWYVAALGFLLLTSLAAGLIPLVPEQRAALRLFHLHANLLGFVGITAIGTLQVLLPTCVARPDPGAAQRLRHDIGWASAGALLVAAGAALAPPLALLGAVSYGAVVVRMLHAWRRDFGATLLQLHGAAPSLAAAAVGLLVLLVLGVAHGFGWMSARPAITGFVVAFLLPMVSGAAAYLLPIWLKPGAQGSWHHALRARLCRWGGLRGLALLLLGLAITIY